MTFSPRSWLPLLITGALVLGPATAAAQDDDNSTSAKGATGSIEADVAAGQHGSVHVSGSWACHMPF